MNKQRFIMVVKGISKEGKSIGIAVKAMLLLILLAPYFAYSSGDYPGENVRLTGKSYFYPTGLEGSPYLHDDWQIASITLENGSVAIGEKVKLNIITNDLIFYNEELKRVFVIDKGTVNNFIVKPGNPDSLIFKKYIGQNIGYRLKDNDFIQVLNTGALSFYVKHLADVINANDVNSKDKIYPRKFYFIQVANTVVQVKPNFSTVYHFFPGKKKEIKKLMKANKINRSNESNLRKLIDLINNDTSICESLKME